MDSIYKSLERSVFWARGLAKIYHIARSSIVIIKASILLNPSIDPL